jgi:hypothetical protein
MISRRPRKEGFGANGTIKASFDSTVSVREKTTDASIDLMRI